MRMGQGVRTGLGHGGITCVLQTQFSSLVFVLITLRINELANRGLLNLFSYDISDLSPPTHHTWSAKFAANNFR